MSCDDFWYVSLAKLELYFPKLPSWVDTGHKRDVHKTWKAELKQWPFICLKVRAEQTQLQLILGEMICWRVSGAWSGSQASQLSNCRCSTCFGCWQSQARCSGNSVMKGIRYPAGHHLSAWKAVGGRDAFPVVLTGSTESCSRPPWAHRSFLTDGVVDRGLLMSASKAATTYRILTHCVTLTPP